MKDGDIGVIFTAETQLSEEYCRINNLYSTADKNADQNEKGYM
jgi:hypothetical protein